MGKQKTNEQFLKELSNINNNIQPLEEYTNVKIPILCKCLICSHEWKVRPDNLLHGKGCPNCRNNKLHEERVKHNDIFLKEIEELRIPIKPLEEYKTGRIPIECQCLKCNYIWKISPDNILKGKGCPKCHAKHVGELCRKSPKIFAEQVGQLSPYIKLKTDYYNVKTKISCECLKCHYEWETFPEVLLQGSSCPKCNSSKGENLIFKYLEDNNIEYEYCKKFSDLIGIGGRCLSYDFYIPSKNLRIEFNGRQHYYSVDLFGGEEQFNTQIIHDKRKKEYADINNINLLIIKYDQISIINDILDDIFLKGSEKYERSNDCI